MLSYDNPVSSPTKMNKPTTAGRSAKPITNATMTHAPHVSVTAAQKGNAGPRHHHIWLVTGPAGCGKSTVAAHLSESLGFPYLEGDEYHPKANIDKMAAGIPLTDSDRWDWLTELREASLRKLADGADGVVLTCSALKRKYRDVIRVAPYYSHDVVLHFVYLHAPEEVLLQRVGARQGHYMGANMVHSQFSILEPPTAEETDVISVDVSGSEHEVQQEALSKVLQAMEEQA
ncbi:P-loop containing nucleoside triphosphate hydrolase protein [Truncatella angustata]|uniref:Gluconokinase n=1 Tax=Truncatella angustata TaxID=152316 RepID=A0A9P8US69_9PEZI|nr:P-loop containing nucleoside triphosphate hydrolase protein [Truncatella angustata]KAH6657492.1 P-loop containing nucleoside triphosphate hydrolase protein [Truncatella angustata]KAH8197877.1 hypothetical protein TruAng_007976 [Truncatella angustata]